MAVVTVFDSTQHTNNIWKVGVLCVIGNRNDMDKKKVINMQIRSNCFRHPQHEENLQPPSKNNLANFKHPNTA